MATSSHRRFVALLFACIFAHNAHSFVIFGYVPEYRFGSLDWNSAARLTTHLVLFSVEPTDEGGFRGEDNMRLLMQPGSAFKEALSRAGDRAPKVLLAVGGSGRSQHFGTVAADKKKRKKLAKRLVGLFKDMPFLSGVDLDWEAPATIQQWRELGKLSKEVRAALEEAGHKDVLVTMGYRPGSGSVAAFSSLQSKKENGKAFVDLFDFCHAMAYTHFDQDRKHSTLQLDNAAREEWVAGSLPMHRLTLGIPFFGVNRKSGESLGYADIIDREPFLAKQPDAQFAKDDIFFVGPNAASQKARYALRQGFGGVMVWELGQDRPLRSGILAEIHRVLSAPLSEMSWNEVIESIGAWSPISEDQLFMGLTAIVGGYLLILVLVGKQDWSLKLPPRKPEESSNGNAADNAANSAPPETTEDDKKEE